MSNEELVALICDLMRERKQLRAALQPFSDMAGELLARNWNASQIVTVLDNPDDPHRITAGDYFAARQAVVSVSADEEPRGPHSDLDR